MTCGGALEEMLQGHVLVMQLEAALGQTSKRPRLVYPGYSWPRIWALRWARLGRDVDTWRVCR
jgi:hypothetical protein